MASTAIPIERTIPAIPGRVSVSLKAASKHTTSSTYKVSPSTDARPGTAYTISINTISIANPIAAALRLVEIASCPSFAPTTLLLNSTSSVLSEPIRMVEANCSAFSAVSIPVIVASPLVIGT